MGRAPCCDKASVKKGPWSPEEDAELRSYIHQHGTGGNWIALPQKIGLKRCGKSCRLRWLNYLRPNIKHGGFSEEEDRIICSLFVSIGSRWSVIASQLPGRTDNDVKNYWNTRLKKKLLGKQQQQRKEPSRRRGRRRTVQESAADGHSGSDAGLIAAGTWPHQQPYPIEHSYPCREPPAPMLPRKNPDLAELGWLFPATTNMDHLLQQQQVYGDPVSSVWSSSTNSSQPETSTGTGINSIWAEIEEMIRFNPARLEDVKGEYETDAINSTQLDQNMNWNDEVMSHSMMYPSTMMIKGKATAYEGITQHGDHLLMQERLHLGM